MVNKFTLGSRTLTDPDDGTAMLVLKPSSKKQKEEITLHADAITFEDPAFGDGFDDTPEALRYQPKVFVEDTDGHTPHFGGDDYVTGFSGRKARDEAHLRVVFQRVDKKGPLNITLGAHYRLLDVTDYSRDRWERDPSLIKELGTMSASEFDKMVKRSCKIEGRKLTAANDRSPFNFDEFADYDRDVA
jgi:hypothetical protein